MTLATRQGTRYTPTAEDVLWLSRAVEAEGPPHDLVAQTLVNGFLWARESLGSARTLAEWVRAYAQPISPAWMPGGEHYEARLAAADEEIATARTEAERERAMADRAAVVAAGERRQRNAMRTRFSAVTVQAVQRALQAPPKFPEAVDYAAAWLEKPEPWKPITTPARTERVNKLWARPGAQGWSGYYVDGPPTPVRSSSSGKVLLIAGLCGALLLAGKRKRRA